MSSVIDGIVIGGAGGAVAGLTVYLVQFLHSKVQDCSDGKKIYEWLKANTSKTTGERFRSTRAIASWNNFTEDRVRYICSLHKKIYLSTGEKQDMWGIHQRDSDFPEPHEFISG